ncbi:MAG: FAD-dependent oxidoreductase [Candidatus Yonathbacteria bacterium]|nr:FAD-dependent oxidoreductase [Candidatus Yonathbacteria bacterium]
MIRHFPARLSEKKIIAENTAELTFAVSDPDFSFKAGQYVSVEIPSLSEAAAPDRYHDFSIASSPLNPKEISIAFRISKSIFKTALLALPIGGTVNIDGPKGVLVLPDTNVSPLIFVAGGIGITPLISMIRMATETSLSQQITLLYCNTSKEMTAYAEELSILEKQNPHFVLRSLIGAPDEKLFAPYMQKTSKSFWYIVGAPAMTAVVKQILKNFDIMDPQVRIEEFSGYLAPLKI